MKLCSKCKLIKPLDEFHKRASSPTGRRWRCIQCEKSKRDAEQVEKKKHSDELIALFIESNKFIDETFIPIYGLEGRFWISDFGRIISFDRRKNTINFLSPAIDGTGYYNTQLRMKPMNLRVRVHQLVAEYFCPRDLCGLTWVNHKNGIKTDNHFKNLEWVTPIGNVKHAVAMGLMNFKGEKHPHHKLTERNVIEMRRLYKTGLTQKQICKMFGVERRQAGDVINGKNWGWLRDSNSSTV